MAIADNNMRSKKSLVQPIVVKLVVMGWKSKGHKPKVYIDTMCNILPIIIYLISIILLFRIYIILFKTCSIYVQL